MANVNLRIVSTLTYVMSTGAIPATPPQIQVERDLNGVVYPVSATRTRRLQISTPMAYEFNYRSTSSFQIINLLNTGNDTLTVNGASFTNFGVNPVLDANGDRLLSGQPIYIVPNSSFSFGLAYYADRGGEYNNSIIIVSNDNVGGSRFVAPTTQRVSEDYLFYVEPAGLNELITTYGGSVSRVFYPKGNDGSIPSFTAYLLNNTSPGYSIGTITPNSVELKFSASAVSNIDGVYPATLVILVGSQPQEVQNVCTVNIDESLFVHLGDWTSPGAYNNSIIGMSYDSLEGQRYLTIGVGTGSENSPEYASGGSEFLNIAALGVGAELLNPPYPYWNLVYRIPINLSSPGTQLSRPYRVKVGYQDYGFYFGEGTSIESMFIVDHDEFGNISVRLNTLRQTTGDTQIDTTLNNLTRAFYYFSTADVGGGRLIQLGAPSGDGTQTQLFTGFNSLGQVTTSLVSIPGNN